MIGSASTALTTAAGMSRNAIWRRPSATVLAEAAVVAGAARPDAWRAERREENRRDRDGEHPLREHVDEERLLDRGRREVGSITRDAKNMSMTAFTLISPSPSVTGTMFTKTRFTAGSRQSITRRSRSSRPRSHGSGRNTWMNVATRIETAYT